MRITNVRRKYVIQTSKPGEVLQSNAHAASYCIAWDMVYCYTRNMVSLCVCLLVTSVNPIKKTTDQDAICVWTCEAEGTIMVLDGAQIYN